MPTNFYQCRLPPMLVPISVAFLRSFVSRLSLARTARNKGDGKRLIQELVAYCDINFSGIGIKCSARDYLKKFYEAFGFIVDGEIDEEDGFPLSDAKRL